MRNAIRRKDAELWILGIVLGVIGNLWVSSFIELAKSSDWEIFFWFIIFLISFILFSSFLKESAELLGIPSRPIRDANIATWIFFLFVGIIMLISKLVR